MADNFNMKQFLAENKLGAYSRLKEEVEEAKKEVSKEDKIAVIKEWIWYTCDEGTKTEDINKYNKMVDIYFADKDDVTKEDFTKIWNKVTEKYGVGDVGADWEAFPETWKDVQTGTLVNEGEAAYEYEKGKAAGEKLAKEDYGKDLEDTEAAKQMDFLAEEEPLKEDASTEEIKETVNIKSIQKAEMSLQNLLRNIATNSNISTDEKEGLINALGELQDFVDEVGYDSEMEKDKYVSDYSKRRASELNEALSPEAFERMASLSNIKAQQDMIKAAEIMMNELTEEGFEVEEVREYFTQLIANDI